MFLLKYTRLVSELCLTDAFNLLHFFLILHIFFDSTGNVSVLPDESIDLLVNTIEGFKLSLTL